MQRDDPLQEGERIMTICNACRYCEGYCAVFPAMEKRLSFTSGDLNYLANLCHNCGECYNACQYAPPHEFAVNVPRTLAEIRNTSYAEYGWPGPLARAFARNGLGTALLVAALLSAAMVAASMILGGELWSAQPGGDFYALVPHNVMVSMFGSVSLFVLFAFVMGFVRFWRHGGESMADLLRGRAWREALRDSLTLRYLHGGGAGCNQPDRERSTLRRWFHHLTMYGFLLCFAATSVATVYHYGFGWVAPYGYFSVPNILGTVGGVGLVIGPAGLLWILYVRDAATTDPSARGASAAFIVLLLLISVSGLALMALRSTQWMGVLLIVHLAVVMALFITMPYGKFVHGLYRGVALLRYALEEARGEQGPTTRTVPKPQTGHTARAGTRDSG